MSQAAATNDESSGDVVGRRLKCGVASPVTLNIHPQVRSAGYAFQLLYAVVDRVGL